MNRRIKTLIFGDAHECRAAADVMRALELLAGHTHEHYHVDDLEEFERNLVDWEPTLLIVLANGAEGMECVYRSKERRPCLPVFWFSDDREFGIQSYRLDCAYFSTKPVTAEKISHAIHRCNHMGIQYGIA